MILINFKSYIELYQNVTSNILLLVTLKLFYVLRNKPLFIKHVTEVTCVADRGFIFVFNVKIHNHISIKNV